MTQIATDDSSTKRTQRKCARVAGFLFLWLIATGVAGLMIQSHIAGSGPFTDTVKRIAASEHLYRAALCIELVETMSALLLAFALYVTLKPVNQPLAQIWLGADGYRRSRNGHLAHVVCSEDRSTKRPAIRLNVADLPAEAVSAARERLPDRRQPPARKIR